MEFKKTRNSSLVIFQSRIHSCNFSMSLSYLVKEVVSRTLTKTDWSNGNMVWQQGDNCYYKKSCFHNRTKHIYTRYHFIRDLVNGGIISLKFCSTNKQIADVFMKSLPRNKHDFFRRQMGVCVFKERISVD